MTISYLLAPIPKWVIMKKDGTTAGGAKLYTTRSLNPTEPKPVFQDASNASPYTNPIIFDADGTAGPFYWVVDSDHLNDTYFLQAFDADGNLLWTIDDYAPPGSGGGGGGGISYVPIQNYITNNQLINHSDPITNPGTNVVIAPSNHHGFTPAQANPIVGTYGVLGPDIRFVKNNTNATDAISFPSFSLSNTALSPDITPPEYINYQCSNSPSGESYKNFQFPITQKVKNLSNQQMTFTIWANASDSSQALSIYLRQYYGSSPTATAESTSTRTLIGTCSLTSTWTKFTIPFTVPNVSGNTLGTPGAQTNDDAIYIQIEVPLGTTCNVSFIKPCLFLGSINPSMDFDSYDEIDSVSQSPRTGDIKIGYSINSAAPLGWAPMNDGTIGNAGSGADLEGAFTFQLYSTLYTLVANTWAPVIGGKTGVTMANAVTDFLAGKPLTLPLALGRALSGSGAGSGLPTYALGENEGSLTSSVTLAESNLPPHTHSYTHIFDSGLSGFGLAEGTEGTFPSFNTGPGNGTSEPFDVAVLPPSTFMKILIKL